MTEAQFLDYATSKFNEYNLTLDKSSLVKLAANNYTVQSLEKTDKYTPSLSVYLSNGRRVISYVKID